MQREAPLKTFNDLAKDDRDRLNQEFQRFARETYKRIEDFRRANPGLDDGRIIREMAAARAAWWTQKGIKDPYRTLEQ